MPFEDDFDRAAFVDPIDGLGTAAIWKGSDAVNGVFERPYIPALEAGLSVPVESFSPTFWAQTDDMPDVASGQTLEVAAVEYSIVEVQPDGEQMVKLILDTK